MKMNQRCTASVLVLVVLVGMLPGCATILSGTNQTINFTSEPPGASVSVGPHSGKTPVAFVLAKGKDYPITLNLGGKKKVLTLARSFDAIGFVNILFWPGFIIDAVSGAMTEYEPDTYSVDFSTVE